jgi:hypothetical protein
MHMKKLQWMVAAWLLALPAALPSDAEAATAPVPKECQNPNLSAAEQARCDFIARTPDLCLRSGLSEETQRFCDELAEAPEPETPPLPRECQNPHLSAAEQARCDFIARTPDLCSRSGLSERTQQFCDELGGAPEPTPGITVSPDVPDDIPGGAGEASLADAANFAWQEFIALNWPALAGTRDTPDESQLFGDPDFEGPLVWHTYRHKVEIYPGQGTPPGFDPSKSDFGYSTVPPQYIYNAEQLGQGANGTGEIPACSGQEPVETPSFINLDEVSQIGLASMFAGVAPQFVSTNQDPQLIRFLAKANQSHFVYVVNPDALEQGGDPLYIGTGLPPPATKCSELQPGETTTYCTAQANFLEVSQGNGNPTTLQEPFISFPTGTIHVKSAWRELTADEEDSSRFYTATVRYYEENEGGVEEPRCYREGIWGLVGLHIEHKTPTAPYFIFATFEQADNLLTEDGTPVENEIVYQDGDPPTLDIVGDEYCESPEDRLFYIEESDNPGLPSGGPICQNARTHPLPQAILNANQDAHQAIDEYASDNGLENPVWLYYKLINVQYQPFDISQVVSGTTSDQNESTFYNNNEVVETDYTLANFSGQISAEGPSTNMPANFDGFDPTRTTFQNVLVFDENNELSETFNMGGCLGCHGIAQVDKGTDFSFILSGGRVPLPETPDVDPPGTTNPQPRAVR